MTTKFKIITGFVVMILLIGGMAAVGFFSLEQSSDRFNEYRRLARLNVAVSDMSTNLDQAAGRMFHYLYSDDKDDVAAVDNALAGFAANLLIAKENAKAQRELEALERLRTTSALFKTQVAAVNENVTIIKNQYSRVVSPNGIRVAKTLDKIAQTAHQRGSIQVVLETAEAWSSFGLTLSVLSRYAESLTEEDAGLVRERIAGLFPTLERMGAELGTGWGHGLFKELTTALTALHEAFTVMDESGVKFRAVLKEMDSGIDAIITELQTLNTYVDQLMHDYGQETLDANTASQWSMQIVSAAGVLLGLVFATVIIMGIVKALTELSRFAGAVAAGDFSQQIHAREKGEIGSVVEAMKQIPAVLQRIIGMADELANNIRTGKMRARLNASDFKGSYGELAVSVNAVGDAYTLIIDSLPLPILAFDATHAPVFLNEKARQTFDGNEEPVQPGEDPTKAMGLQAMQNQSAQSVETVLNARGKRMNATLTAMPLADMHGIIVGYYGIINDITEIRQQQQVMMDVAAQASAISNRVAAASEELSSHVEHVSQGAELQRERVGSTASAMTEMTATVLEVARSASEASEQSEGTRKKAQDGATLVSQVVSAINSVNAVSQSLQSNMEELGNQAESISSVMDVISDIADQTNLLALNAAIEAARAGEAGRGFAVVADEVRKLAEKTMSATHEVGTSINAVQHSARANIDEVGKAVASIEDATGLANKSGKALNEIVTLASANSSVVASIATAAEEQSATSEEINRAIEEINKLVGETTEGMVQSSAAVQNFSSMAQELRRVMEDLR